ncbi:DUF4177 domain-containing protein [Roseovarius sp.]|jgi:hypothetical protein
MYEYKVIPAPARGKKAAGVKGPGPRFALALEEVMNALAAEGWDYQRSDILPSEERQGLTSTHTVYRSVLVFRRALSVEVATAPDARAGVETQRTRPDMIQDETAGGDVPQPRSAQDETSDAAQDSTKGDRPQS